MTNLHPLLQHALSDRYAFIRELGEGGMATVYLAHDRKHDRDVAIKVLREALAASLGRERFLREIQLVAKLAHPHILPLFDSGEAGGALYYVMPNAEGASLRDLLSAGRMPVEQAVRIATDVASALDFAHRHNVVHRDIKPENIMMHDGHAMVADFGIGKALSVSTEHTLTQGGLSIGTPAYMSPEQAVGENVDGRSDLYSLGCVLYEMLVGEPPFTGQNAQAVLAKRFVQIPADVTALREGISRPIAHAVRKALARNAEDRHDTAARFAAALAEVETAVPATAVAATEKSLAVLPFTNMSGDPENEFFADGITEEILIALSAVPDLHVAGRASSFSFKGKQLDVQSVGLRLHVRTVLEGSVRRVGTRVRIAAQLSDATDGFQLWSERYDRDIADIFAVQEEIAAAIAGNLKTTLTVGAAARTQRATRSMEAYEAYLKGNALIQRRGQAMKPGLALMDEALRLDPEFALAWSASADAYAQMGLWSMIPLEVARSRTNEAATNAMRLAPDLAESNGSWAFYLMMYEWNFAEAEGAYRRALSLNTGHTQTVAWYNQFYRCFVCGDVEQAITGLEAAQSRDPLSGYLAAMLANQFAIASNNGKARAWVDAAIDLSPDAFLTLWARQFFLVSVRDWPQAIDAAHTVLSASGRLPAPLTWLGLSLIGSGDSAGGRATYDELVARSTREPVSPALLAALAAALVENSAAIAYCEQAVRRKDPMFLVFMRSFPGAEALIALPEHRRIVASLGLPGVPLRAAASGA